MTRLLAGLCVALCGAITGCGDSAVPVTSEVRPLASCDRAAVQQWLEESDLENWSIGDRSTGPAVLLPDTEPNLSERMRQELTDRCGDEVAVEVGPPDEPA